MLNLFFRTSCIHLNISAWIWFIFKCDTPHIRLSNLLKWKNFFQSFYSSPYQLIKSLNIVILKQLTSQLLKFKIVFEVACFKFLIHS